MAGSEIISAEIQSQGYDRSLNFMGKKDPKRIKHPRKLLLKMVKGIPLVGARWRQRMLRSWVPLGYPMDQTHGEALAQIQIIVRKK